MIELRDYQLNQIDFLERKIDFSNVLGLESGTGSGKTYVALEFAKRWLEKPENQLSNVIITTGFNNLVFLLEKRAKEFGLNNIKVLIGTKAANCPLCLKEHGINEFDTDNFKVFTETEIFRCKDKHKHLDVVNKTWSSKVCPYTKEFYSNYYNELSSNVGQIIITNHSSFLIHQEFISNISLVIVDEAHTFASFYDSYVRLELDKSDLQEIDETINKIKPPMNKIIKMNMERGNKLPQVQIDKLYESIQDKTLALKAKEFFEIEPSISNYITTSPESFTIDRFYKNFDFKIRPKFLLMSATLDKYSRMMFGCKDLYYYKEKKMFVDFTQSEFIAMPNEDFKTSLINFINYVDSKGLQNGLCLSTTITDVNNALSLDGINGFKMFDADSIKEFEKYKDKKILVGSRRLFQGIDIAGLEFVCMNKIPFPNWDEKTQKMRDYITNFGKNGIDFWKDYSVPKTENDLVQGLGRLWRSIDSKGIVSVFDNRIKKHSYLIRHVMKEYRYGIKISIMEEDGTINDFNVEKQEEKDNRKDTRIDDRNSNFG